MLLHMMSLSLLLLLYLHVIVFAVVVRSSCVVVGWRIFAPACCPGGHGSPRRSEGPRLHTTNTIRTIRQKYRTAGSNMRLIYVVYYIQVYVSMRQSMCHGVIGNTRQHEAHVRSPLAAQYRHDELLYKVNSALTMRLAGVLSVKVYQ